MILNKMISEMSFEPENTYGQDYEYDKTPVSPGQPIDISGDKKKTVPDGMRGRLISSFGAQIGNAIYKKWQESGEEDLKTFLLSVVDE